MFDTLQYYLISTAKHDRKISRKEFNLFKKEHDTSKSILFVRAYDKLLPHYKELSFAYSFITVLCLGSQQIAALLNSKTLTVSFCVAVLFFAILCMKASLKASMHLNGPIVYMREANTTLAELDEDFINAVVIGDEIWVGETYVYVISPNGLQICNKASIKSISLEPFKDIFGKDIKDAAVLTINGHITIRKPVHDLVLWSYIRDRMVEVIKK